jgi:DNA-binding transcriptional regulator YdaS (Cro superfamily)
MHLKAFLKTLGSEEEREAFAGRCETSLGHLRNICYGKACSPELAALIECASSGVVTRQELLPGKWQRIWPELAAATAAPAPTLPAPNPADWPLVRSRVHGGA